MTDSNRPDAGWTFTGHAEMRMRQRGFTADDVTRIIEHAEVDMPGGEGSPLRRAVEGEAAVIYSPEERTVLTVMWRRPSLTPAAP